MDSVFKRRWQTILFFSALAILFIGIFYGAYHGPWDPRFRRRMEQTTHLHKKAPPSPIQKDKITLTCNEPLTVGKNRFVFHGIEKNQVHISVYLLELDPEFAYHYRIPIKEAVRGFRLGGQSLVLLSKGKNRIKVGTKGSVY